MEHDRVCLLRNRWISAMLTVLFLFFVIVDILDLAHFLPVAGGHARYMFLMLPVSVALVVYLFRVWTCLWERVILSLMLFQALFKWVAVLRPETFADIGKYQKITGVVAGFSCAVISGIAFGTRLRE